MFHFELFSEIYIDNYNLYFSKKNLRDKRQSINLREVKRTHWACKVPYLQYTGRDCDIDRTATILRVHL